MRQCRRCGEIKPPEAFAWRRKSAGQLQSYCRSCQAAYNREHYLANRQLYIDRARRRKEAERVERTSYLIEYFAAHPCADCGESDPMVLEVDHLGDKRFTIGEGIAYRSWPAVLAEIEKCEVVCANCHKRRTKRRQRSMRFLLTED